MLHAESTRSGGLAREQSAVADSHALLVFENQSLEELTKYIDWTPFFKVWELAGSYPKILDDDVVGEHARQLFDDAKQMLQQIIDENWLQARAVVGLFPANQVGDDDIELYADDSRKEVLTTLHHLRQQNQKPPGRPNQCLADFVAPKDTGLKDYLGAFAVTAGLGIDDGLGLGDFGRHDDVGLLGRLLTVGTLFFRSFLCLVGLLQCFRGLDLLRSRSGTLGFRFLRKRDSNFIGGVGADNQLPAKRKRSMFRGTTRADSTVWLTRMTK